MRSEDYEECIMPKKKSLDVSQYEIRLIEHLDYELLNRKRNLEQDEQHNM